MRRRLSHLADQSGRFAIVPDGAQERSVTSPGITGDQSLRRICVWISQLYPGNRSGLVVKLCRGAVSPGAGGACRIFTQKENAGHRIILLVRLNIHLVESSSVVIDT